MTNDMSAARAARKGDKPIGRPTEPQRLDDIRVVQELYLDGKTQTEIANITQHTPATVKRYLQDLTAVIEVHNKEKVEEKRCRAIQRLRHLQSRAEGTVFDFSPSKGVSIAKDIEMDIAKLEGLLIEKVEHNGVQAITVTIEREKPVGER